MPSRTNCANCGVTKTTDRFSEYLCLACETVNNNAITAAREHNANHDNQIDVGAAARAALSGHSHTAHRGQTNSSAGFDRHSTQRLTERLQIEEGSHADPTRAIFRG